MENNQLTVKKMEKRFKRLCLKPDTFISEVLLRTSKSTTLSIAFLPIFENSSGFDEISYAEEYKRAGLWLSNGRSLISNQRTKLKKHVSKFSSFDGNHDNCTVYSLHF